MRDKLQVMKFGGTSVGDALCLRRAAQIVALAARECRVVVVVSAMSGVTTRLIEAARRASEGDLSAAQEIAFALGSQHLTAIEKLFADNERRARLVSEMSGIIGEVSAFCHGSALLKELTPRTLDMISSAGERLSARLLAGALCELGTQAVAVDATEIIVTDDAHGQAEPLMEKTRAAASGRLLPLMESGQVPIVTGFIGANAKGTLTTLGRGGSDYSATILGAALEASEVIIWTDVDGVMTADPRLVPEARLLREISYNEAGDLAYFGAKVLHPKTLRPVVDASIPVWIRNSFAPEKPGTKITREGRPALNGVKAITATGNVSLITVGGIGIVGLIGIAAKTFSAAASVRANVLLISQSSSENDICFIVDTADAAHTVEALRQTFAQDLAHQQVEHITVNANIAIVAVVGERMRGTPGIAGRTFSALGREGINIIAIAQGSSEYNVSCVVEAGDMRAAVLAVHGEFKLDQRQASLENEGDALAAFEFGKD
jgi:aspartokinase/homoserine dehydrogenase 1